MHGHRLLLWLLLEGILPALAFVAPGRSPSANCGRRNRRKTASGSFFLSQRERDGRRPEPAPRWSLSRCNYSNRQRGDEEDAFWDGKKNVMVDPVLQSRLDDMKLQALEATYRMPPNPNWSAIETVAGVLHSLRSCDDPTPDAGIRSLLRTSTLHWKRLMYRSVGARLHYRTGGGARKMNLLVESHVVSALRSSMGRPNNQYRILLEGDNDDDDDEEQPYSVVFPSEPVDYMDGSCWLECQLRRKTDDALLITTGWQLEKDGETGCWMIDRIDWQDFREKFRPGIGREEWMRICG